VVLRNIVVEPIKSPEPEVEIVERKGIGHPDSVCDGIVEKISSDLCKEYLRVSGEILHHNVDKMLISAGEADVDYGKGKIIKDIFMCLAGRATAKTPKHSFEVEHIARKAAREYLKKNLRFLDLEDDVVIDCRIGRGSADLVEGFERKGKKSSNDTSFGVGYAPFSKLENAVLAIERSLNSPEFKKRVPACGEDVKVMGLKQDGKLKVTVAAAIVSKFVSGLSDYKEVKAKILEEAVKSAKKFGGEEIEVSVNTMDNYEKDMVYITATGLSMENGDDGSVGRGNRVNGLITPMRPMSLEAAAGKNPVTHVGKIYNCAAFELSNLLVKEVPEIEYCEINLLSQIGRSIDDPKIAGVEIRSKTPKDFEAAKRKATPLIDSYLADISSITMKIVEGKLGTF
jgi:S-adenosylmethionine synthetase